MSHFACRTQRNVFLVAACFACAFACAGEPAGGDVATSYVEGIELLEAGDYKRAVEQFSQAIAANDENAEYHRARGVANTLAENFSAAIADLQRAMRLRDNDTETRVWLACAYRMGGDTAKGAQFFLINRSIPADYANMLYNEMAMAYWQSKTNGSYWDKETKSQIAVREPVKKQFIDAAKTYAQRHKATGQAAGKLLASRVKAAMDRADWPAAARDLTAMRVAAPDDVELRGQWAQCLLGLGDAYHAREEFTRTLCILPLWGEGYLGRAQAAAMLGDVGRAAADLEIAASLGAKSDAASAAVQKLSAQHAAQIRNDSFEHFIKDMQADAPIETLIDDALAVHFAFNDAHAAYADQYQQRIWALSDALRGDNASAARHDMLARFLYNNNTVPIVWNGPRASEQLRPQSSNEKQQEFARAFESVDAALKIRPAHPNALATKGWMLYALGRTGEAEELADRGLAAEGRNVRLLRLKNQSLVNRAAELSARASALRAGRTETSTEQRSDGVYKITKTYPPTAAQLAEALALDAQAAELRNQAAQVGAALEQVQMKVIPGLLSDGGKTLAGGDVKTAQNSIEQAFSLDPENPDVLKSMTELYKKIDDTRLRTLFALLAQPLTNTSAAAKLKTAWEQINRTMWQSANTALDEAEQINATDARIPAYRSIAAAGRGDKHAADQFRRAALALEEARARLSGTSFLSANNTPLRLDEFGLAMIVRLKHANALLDDGKAQIAFDTLGVNIAFENRFPKEQRVEAIPTALLPDPTLDLNTIPDAPTLASLLAASRLAAGKALIALGRTAEAQQEYRAIRAYLANWPATAKGRETMNEADSWARLGQAEAAFAAKDFEAAHQLLSAGEGWPWNLPEALEKRRKALEEQVRAARNGRINAEARANERLSPKEQRIKSMRETIAQLQKQRDTIATNQNSPTASEREKQLYQSSITELDKVIAGYTKSLNQLEQTPENP